MNLLELNPHIRYARIHHSYFPSKNEISMCYDCRIFFVEQATGYVTVNGTEYNISKGTAIYFPPKTKYRFNFINSENFKVIVLDFDLVNDFSYLKSSLGTANEKTFSNEKVLDYPVPKLLEQAILKPIPQINSILTQCANSFLLRDSFYRETSSALLKLCLIEFVREEVKNEAYSDLCEQVLHYIHENYMLHTLTNADIAEKFNYHPGHLGRIIKDKTGKSLHQYIIDYRLRIAKNFLLTTQYDIEQVSWKSGFSSTAYFIKMFHKYTGTTPKKYRQLRLHTEL